MGDASPSSDLSTTLEPISGEIDTHFGPDNKMSTQIDTYL
jgi:hypothetical protein